MMSYKNRNSYLVLGSFFFAFVVYFLTIKKTIDLKISVENQKREIEQVQNAPQRIASVEYNLKSIEDKMKRYFFSEERNQEYVLGLVSKFCATHHLVLKEFPQVSVLEKGDFDLETTTISAQGTFSNLLDLVYYFEQQIKIGRVSSISFSTTMDYKTKKKILIGTIFLQNIRKNNE